MGLCWDPYLLQSMSVLDDIDSTKRMSSVEYAIHNKREMFFFCFMQSSTKKIQIISKCFGDKTGSDELAI